MCPSCSTCLFRHGFFPSRIGPYLIDNLVLLVDDLGWDPFLGVGVGLEDLGNVLEVVECISHCLPSIKVRELGCGGTGLFKLVIDRWSCLFKLKWQETVLNLTLEIHISWLNNSGMNIYCKYQHNPILEFWIIEIRNVL